MCAMEKVLIVDDERQLRELLAKMVALEGFEVSQADSCRAAMSQIRRATPDIVICDVKLLGNFKKSIRKKKRVCRTSLLNLAS